MASKQKNRITLLKPIIYDLIWVGMTSFILRLSTMLTLFTLFNQTWSIYWLSVLPIIKFNANTGLYITLNSYSLIATSVVTFLIFLMFAYRNLNTINKRIFLSAWYVAMLLPFMQYILMALSKGITAQSLTVLNTSGFICLALAILASIITLIRINKRYRIETWDVRYLSFVA